MKSDALNVVFLGLSITSSWGNGHATTYRGLLRELCARGHDVLFLERDMPWYARNRDLPAPPFGRTELYYGLDDLRSRFGSRIAGADAVVVGSFVPEGKAVGEWVQETARGVTAFYDIDTPVTLARISRGECEYLSPGLIPGYSLYLSFTGGPTLDFLERSLGSPRALPLYCSFDPELYHPEKAPARWDLGYLGTYSSDRQPMLDALLAEPARRQASLKTVVAGPQYPPDLGMPGNVERIEHLPPSGHRRFYNEQKFTVNVTREDMKRAGYSPSVRLFEAAACGVPVISDAWDGLNRFFAVGGEILVASGPDEVLAYVNGIGEAERKGLGMRARERALEEHTAAKRAQTLEGYLMRALSETNPEISREPSLIGFSGVDADAEPDFEAPGRGLNRPPLGI